MRSDCSTRPEPTGEPTSLVYCSAYGQEIGASSAAHGGGLPGHSSHTFGAALQADVLLGAFVERVGQDHLHLGHRLRGWRPTGTRANAGVPHRRRRRSGGVRNRARGGGRHPQVARAQRYPSEGRPRWNGALLWRGTAEADPVLDGRTIWSGRPPRREVRGLSHRRPRRRPPGAQLHRRVASPLESPLGRAEDWNRARRAPGLPARVRRLGLRSAGRARHHPIAPGTFLFPMIDPSPPVPRWTFGRSTLLGDAAPTPCTHRLQRGFTGHPGRVVLAGCLRLLDDDVAAAFERYEADDSRRPPPSCANRGLGPEVPMQVVHERAPTGSTTSTGSIRRAEIDEVTEAYRQTAGFAHRRSGPIRDPSDRPVGDGRADR